MIENEKPIGLLRYNLFWDNTPFAQCFLLIGILGYKDCGGFVIDVLGYEQPMEMLLVDEKKGKYYEDN